VNSEPAIPAQRLRVVASPFIPLRSDRAEPLYTPFVLKENPRSPGPRAPDPLPRAEPLYISFVLKENLRSPGPRIPTPAPLPPFVLKENPRSPPDPSPFTALCFKGKLTFSRARAPDQPRSPVAKSQWSLAPPNYCTCNRDLEHRASDLAIKQQRIAPLVNSQRSIEPPNYLL